MLKTNNEYKMNR